MTPQFLSQLQLLDSQIAARRNLLRDLETRLADVSPVVAAQKRLSEAEAAVQNQSTLIQDAELRDETLGERLKEVTARLYGGRVSNPKELAGLEQDAAMLKRQRDELENQLLEWMTEMDTRESQVRAARTAHEAVQAEAGQSHTQLLREADQIKKQLEELGTRRAALAARISPETLQVYTEIGRTRAGRAVAQIKSDACSVCGMQVPSGPKSRVLAGESLVFCSSCGRILIP